MHHGIRREPGKRVMKADRGAEPEDPGTSNDGFSKDVRDFLGHCSYIKSLYTLAMRIWRDSDDTERGLMESVSPSFVLDFGQVISEYLVLAACRITDAANDGKKNENFTVEFFVNCFPPNSQTFQTLEDLRRTMDGFRKKILPARHKIVAHADRAAIRKGEPLGAAEWKEWEHFWSALKTFVNVLNERALGTPYDIDIAGVRGDAEMLLKALRQSRFFETLVKSENSSVRDACLKIALPP
jgi:hypothetical protein